MTPLLGARALRKTYGRGDALVRAVDDVDLDVAPGSLLARQSAAVVLQGEAA